MKKALTVALCILLVFAMMPTALADPDTTGYKNLKSWLDRIAQLQAGLSAQGGASDSQDQQDPPDQQAPDEQLETSGETPQEPDTDTGDQDNAGKQDKAVKYGKAILSELKKQLSAYIDKDTLLTWQQTKDTLQANHQQIVQLRDAVRDPLNQIKSVLEGVLQSGTIPPELLAQLPAIQQGLACIAAQLQQTGGYGNLESLISTINDKAWSLDMDGALAQLNDLVGVQEETIDSLENLQQQAQALLNLVRLSGELTQELSKLGLS